MGDYDEIMSVVYDGPPRESQPVLTGVPLPGEEPGELDGAGDEGTRQTTLMRELVGWQAAIARSCEDEWEARYHRYVALPIIAVLGLGIDVVSHRRTFGGLLAFAFVILLAAWLGLL